MQSLATFSIFALNHWLHQHRGVAYCKHAALDGSSRGSLALDSLAASHHNSCIVQLTNGREHAVALRRQHGCWWLLDPESAEPVPQSDWSMLRMPEHTDPSVGIASQPRLNSSSARKKGQPKRSCIERSEVTTEYILTLLGNFKEINSTLAARAWMMASA
jgi:hypothetical protein